MRDDGGGIKCRQKSSGLVPTGTGTLAGSNYDKHGRAGVSTGR